MKTKRIKIILITVSVFLVLGIFFYQPIRRVMQVMRLFDSDVIVHNFRNMDQIFAKRIVYKSDSVFVLPEFSFAQGMTQDKVLPPFFYFNGKKYKTKEYLKKTWTTGFLVLYDGKIFFEKYYLGNDEKSKVISWSVAKSILSALFGIAYHDGLIQNLKDPVTKYVPYLKGSGYENVSIKNVLQMSSGVRFNEDYGDFYSDINKMGRALALNTSIDEFVRSLQPERKPGTVNHYVSMDTQVLGMILREVTGKTISQYMTQKLWQRIGTEENAYWLLDNEGMELVFGGLNAVLRDYARFGLLYMNQGKWNGQQIVPQKWVVDSVTPDAPHLMPGRKEKGQAYVYGYGYQWWIPADSDGDFLALGVYNQNIWVSPKHKVVIVKSSAYPQYNTDGPMQNTAAVALYRAIVKHIQKNIVPAEKK